MPQSTYSRIYDILSVLNQTQPIEISRLAAEIGNRQTESFAIWIRPRGSTTSEKSYCSEASIRRLIRFTERLELIEIAKERTCAMNAIGRHALQGNNYPTQLGAQVVKYMREDIGLPFEDLEKHIAGIRHPELADADTIYRTLVPARKLPVSEPELRRLLYLLQRCGRLQGRIRKVYSTLPR